MHDDAYYAATDKEDGMSPTMTEARASLRGGVTFRKPETADGAAIWRLIRRSKPLDENSMYCNLIQCDHFADTCVLAEVDGEVAGWISAHIPPSEDDTLFVWQVAVAKEARGQGLGRKMLEALLDREECEDVAQLKTTITRDNEASWGLFTRFADRIGAPVSSEPQFISDEHFDGEHATEHMVTIDIAEADADDAKAA